MMTVLVVHREEGAVAWLKSYLETAGFRVVVARDGPAALDLARREPPALVILDLMPPAPAGCSDDDAGGAERCPEIPPEPCPELRRRDDEGLVEGMDGCEFLRRLRRESNVPVIVLGRWDDKGIKLAALESGADDYLTWPYNRLELLARMRAVLRRVGRYKRTTPNDVTADRAVIREL
jgi:two-component system alkaline phosphatase synthesis response regulator PhoP